ncbi:MULTISPECIES: hypothetical protein [unclassified Duganella]|uniref:hypothetical protein n=1 Tax=unclassified Duganella TaxID=2636909 RepID=UPI0015879FC7|nr:MULTISPECIES: hypothetical protein [unclassified Duganella]
MQKPLHWVRSEDAPIRQIFSIHQWKGGQVAPAWGVSLDFVPDFSGAGVKWHRTHKSAIFDLCVDAHDSDLDMPYTKGAGPMIERVEHVISHAILRAESFWSMASSLENLPAAIDWLKAYLSPGGLGLYRYTQAPLAIAFVLAKVGRSNEARLAFAQFLVRERLMVDTKREKLLALLDNAIAEGGTNKVFRPPSGA